MPKPIKRVQPTTPTPEHVDRMTTERGWWWSQLVLIEYMMAGRWVWWLDAIKRGEVGDAQIPQIEFNTSPHCNGGVSQFAHKWPGDEAMDVETGTSTGLAKELCDLIRSVLDHGNTRVDDIVQWWLWACGDGSIKKRPVFHSPDVAVRLYMGMGTVARMLAHPADWASWVLSQFVYTTGGSAAAWFPTPMCIVTMMTQMVMGEGDHRFKSVNEPCCGTGGMLLMASNHCLDLSGNDVDLAMVHWCRLQAWLYVPWMVYSGKKIIRELAQRPDNAATVKPARGHGVRVLIRNAPKSVTVKVR